MPELQRLASAHREITIELRKKLQKPLHAYVKRDLLRTFDSLNGFAELPPVELIPAEPRAAVITVLELEAVTVAAAGLITSRAT